MASLNNRDYGVYPKEYFINGSDREVVASYLELYEEGEVKHINGVWPVFLFEQLFAALPRPPGGKIKPTIKPKPRPFY